MKREPLIETVQVGPLSLNAAVEGVSEDGLTFDLVFSTGAPVERWDPWSGKRYIEKLSLDPAHVRLDRLNAGAPLLNSHSAWDLSDVIGVIEEGSAKLSGKKGTAKARLSAHDDVARIRQDVKDRVLRNVSVGYRVYRFEEVSPAKENALPIRTATDWEPFEVSLVPMGADPGARVRGERVESHPCVIVRLEEETMKQNGQTEPAAEPAATPSNPTPTPAPAHTRAVLDIVPVPGPADAQATARAEGAEAERQRQAAIRQLCGSVRGIENPAQLADELCGRACTIDQARTEILQRLSAQSAEHEPAPGRVRVGDDEREKRQRGISAALIARAGVADIIRLAQKAKPDHPAFAKLSLDPGEFRGYRMDELGRMALEQQGVKLRGLDRSAIAEAILGRWFEGLAHRDIGGAQSASDFAVAFESTLHKTLLAAYVVAPRTWPRFCATGSLTDFRPHPRYRTGYLGVLDEVGQGGEFKNKSLPDATKESITGKTKGNILALTRQALINDDMGIFSRIATQIGYAVALSIETDVYALLALNGGLGPAMNDGKTLFHADHANIGDGSALSVAGLDADYVILSLQEDPEGNEILDLQPAILVVPRGLSGTARVINEAEYDTDATTSTGRTDRTPNRVRGMIRDIVGSGRMTGTRRYVFADPAVMPIVEVAFLDGQQEPFVAMQDGWRTDGREWKYRLDYAVGAIEYRGAVTNAGVEES
jgi:hypothetical protein